MLFGKILFENPPYPTIEFFVDFFKPHGYVLMHAGLAHAKKRRGLTHGRTRFADILCFVYYSFSNGKEHNKRLRHNLMPTSLFICSNIDSKMFQNIIKR